MRQPVVGLEVHLALRTATKLFCSCAADPADDAPNSNVCPVCLGLPGSLPTVNERAVDLAAAFATALGAEVAPVLAFDRKHYSYPDSPKNYQLSQHAHPIGRGGRVALPSGKVVRISHCHLEEDAGRLVHPPYADHSLVDLGRAGTPLVELVTEPDISSPSEAREFLEEVQAIARAVGASDASPEAGKMRADVNVSLTGGDGRLGTKVEVKNLNSFRNVASAIEFETRRQERLLDAGRRVVQETRGFNEGGQKTYTLRVKEGSEDYRYLPDPDLPTMPMAARAAAIASSLPELPRARASRYGALGLRDADSRLIAYDLAVATAFDAAMEAEPARARGIASWLTVEVAGLGRHEGGGTPDPAAAVRLARLVAMVEDGEVSGPTGKEILPEVLAGADPRSLVSQRGLAQVTGTSELRAMVEQVLASHPELVERVRVNPKAVNALLGEVMKASRGTAKPDAVRAMLEERLVSG